VFVDTRAYLTAHTCARRGATGAVWCWGANNVGQLGDGTTVQRTSPIATSGMQ
jgi:alpha-tubulin suppressor-like RCC1 family protein